MKTQVLDEIYAGVMILLIKQKTPRRNVGLSDIWGIELETYQGGGCA